MADDVDLVEVAGLLVRNLRILLTAAVLGLVTGGVLMYVIPRPQGDFRTSVRLAAVVPGGYLAVPGTAHVSLSSGVHTISELEERFGSAFDRCMKAAKSPSDSAPIEPPAVVSVRCIVAPHEFELSVVSPSEEQGTSLLRRVLDEVSVPVVYVTDRTDSISASVPNGAKPGLQGNTALSDYVNAIHELNRTHDLLRAKMDERDGTLQSRPDGRPLNEGTAPADTRRPRALPGSLEEQIEDTRERIVTMQLKDLALSPLRLVTAPTIAHRRAGGALLRPLIPIGCSGVGLALSAAYILFVDGLRSRREYRSPPGGAPDAAEPCD